MPLLLVQQLEYGSVPGVQELLHVVLDGSVVLVGLEFPEDVHDVCSLRCRCGYPISGSCPHLECVVTGQGTSTWMRPTSSQKLWSDWAPRH